MNFILIIESNLENRCKWYAKANEKIISWKKTNFLLHPLPMCSLGVHSELKMSRARCALTKVTEESHKFRFEYIQCWKRRELRIFNVENVLGEMCIDKATFPHLKSQNNIHQFNLQLNHISISFLFVFSWCIKKGQFGAVQVKMVCTGQSPIP